MNAFIPSGSLSNPFPSGLLAPTGASAGLLTFAGRDIIFNNPNRSIPFVHSYSLGVQHQLPGNIVVDASFVGSRTNDVNTNDNQAGTARNLNVPTVQQLAQAHQNSSFFTQSVTNPFAGLLPGTNLNASTISRRQLLLPYPQFGNVLEGGESVGRVWYDALQLDVHKRAGLGLTLDANYTWSKNLEALTFLNDQDPLPAKVLAAGDRPHRFVLSSVYQLPFGQGKQFANQIGKGWNSLIGGWEYNVLAIIQSGTPLSLPGNFDLIGDASIGSQNFNQWFNGCELLLNGTTRAPSADHKTFVTGCSNPVWSQRDTATTLRTTPLRSSTIRNPWAKQWDMSLDKRFLFTEHLNAEFRLEAFNVFNTPIRPSPTNDPNNAQFGLVTLNQTNFPRQVQLGFKFNF